MAKSTASLIKQLIEKVERLEKELQELKAQPKQEFHYHTHFQQEATPAPIYPQQPWISTPWPNTSEPYNPFKPTTICKTETHTVPALPNGVVYNGTLNAAPSRSIVANNCTAGGIRVK